MEQDQWVGWVDNLQTTLTLVDIELMEFNKVLVGNAEDVLKTLPDKSVQLIVTSPPYYQQRNYAADNQLGSEPTPEQYLDSLDRVFRECLRVVNDTGSVVFNVGDKYHKGSLLMLPARFALNCLKHDILLINELRWIKPNPVPKQDPLKLTPAHEPFYIFAKNRQYVFNKNHHQPVKASGKNIGQSYFQMIEKSSLSDDQKALAKTELQECIKEIEEGKIAGMRMKIRGLHAEAYRGQPGGRQYQMDRKGFTIIKMRGGKCVKDYLEYPVSTIKGMNHPAIFPQSLIEELILLLSRPNDLVLDPFIGSGTVALASIKTKRDWLGIEINPEYAELCEERTKSTTDCAA